MLQVRSFVVVSRELFIGDFDATSFADLVGHHDIVGDELGADNLDAAGDQTFAHGGSALVSTLAGRALRAHRDDARAELHVARNVPLFPPVFSTSRTSVRCAPRSTDFSMS